MLFLVGLPFKSRAQVTFWLSPLMLKHHKTNTRRNKHRLFAHYCHSINSYRGLTSRADKGFTAHKHSTRQYNSNMYWKCDFCAAWSCSLNWTLFGEPQFNLHLHVTILTNHGCERAYKMIWFCHCCSSRLWTYISKWIEDMLLGHNREKGFTLRHIFSRIYCCGSVAVIIM